jgi:hypothetical protein
MVVVYCGTPDVRLLANSGSMADEIAQGQLQKFALLETHSLP